VRFVSVSRFVEFSRDFILNFAVVELLLWALWVSNPMLSPHCEVHPHESEGETRKRGGKSNISDEERT
jgi:hypothetical protein